MLVKRGSNIALAAVAAFMITACGTAEYDWNKARAANTLAAYQDFFRHHSDDRRADNARGRILALQDDHAWVAARATNTAEAYGGYLRLEPGGIHAAEARYWEARAQTQRKLKATPN
jgi:hypothetical protein